MKPLSQIFTSPTFYTLLVTFVLGVFQAFGHLLPVSAYGTASTLLTLLAGYFHVTDTNLPPTV